MLIFRTHEVVYVTIFFEDLPMACLFIPRQFLTALIFASYYKSNQNPLLQEMPLDVIENGLIKACLSPPWLDRATNS